MSHKHFSIEEREIIAIRLAEGVNPSRMAKELGRHHSSVIAEIKRNNIDGDYFPARAQALADRRRSESKEPWKMVDPRIASYVKRCLKCCWSPEEIAGRMEKDFPDNNEMRISHETIYAWIREDKRLGGKWRSYLRQSGKKRRKRYGSSDNRGRIVGRVDIDKRPKIVDRRARLGDWEGDTVEGAKGSGYLVTLVDRKSKYLVLGFSKTKEAETVRRAVERSYRRHGELPCKTLTLDNGKEFADHQRLSANLELEIYFAKPYHSWERGLNENTNGLLRQYFPKGMDFGRITPSYLRKVEAELNARPRKTLNYRTPEEVMWE